MEASSGVQAPVTRLRRRLSVEQSEDLNSPGPATPTKKRGGRLAAKPQLELIDENAGSTSKKSTKKAPVKELAEASEEKPLTPSRRSSRIRSNTSIISETAQSVGSPRAKRAARRTSQVGSDNETVVTPVRMTRRTRKDSASTIDNLETTLATKPANITEIIIEESEVHTQKPNDSPTNVPLRKSPRLKEKIKGKQNSDNEQADSMSNDAINDLNFVKQHDHIESAENKSVTADTEVTVPEKSQENSADTSLDTIKELDKKPKTKSSNPNKSMSALDNANYFKSKRQRTKSLSIVSQSQTNDIAFLSDNEKNKKKAYSISKVQKVSDYRFASGDSKLINTNMESDDKNPVSKNSDTCNLSLNESHSASDLLPNTISPKENKENLNVEDNVVQNSVLNFLKNPPSLILKTTVIYEDSDMDMKSKVAYKNIDSEDQCVPVVETTESSENFDKIGSPTLNKSDKKNKEDENVLNNSSLLNKSKEIISRNDSCEPMDVDVTIPNIAFSETSQLNKSSNLGNRKSTRSEDNTSFNKSSNKSKRNSSIALSTSQNFEKSCTENKSTLILSQIKDVSSSENNVTKSPKPYQEILSKSTNSDIKNDNTMNKKNISLDYSTSTPLQQKHLKKIGLQINTSLIENTKNDTKKTTNSPNISKKEISKCSEINTSTDKESSSEDESSNIKSLLDNEADVASDDYESGDSQNDEERQYEEENEIVEKGETLNSDYIISNDSDYEKDSFVVGSSDEDQNLLSGSGDDLSMSDNELMMSAKSKKKYNERKLKEQKKASKEMFEARHKLDANTKKSKQSRKLESSEDEIIGHGKKNKHQRLDSTHEDNSDTSIVNDKSFNQKKKTKRLLSESDTNESVTKEPEITNVFYNSAIENDPLSTQVKQEPKTPLKDFNVSTDQITEAIEEVVVENNISFTKVDQTLDPLHATMMDDDSSSLSENSEIKNNYDSILNQLNKESEKSKTIKSLDLSLNSINKHNKNSKIPIVEELNLTQTKKSKQDKNTDTLVGNDVVDSPKTKTTCAKVNQDNFSNFDKDSSESIDLHLLFSEESNETSPNKKEKEDDYFIPLKRTPGKINILNQQDNEQSANDEIHFVIDTQGTRRDTNNSHDTSLNNSTKKRNKKNKTSNVSQTFVTHVNNSDDEGAPLEIPFNSSKTEKSRMSISTILENQEAMKQHNNIPDISSSGSTKKKKKHSVTLDDQSVVPAAETVVQAPESTKKSKKKLRSESQQHEDTAETSLIIPGSGKKKKNKLHIEQSDLNEAETSIGILPGSGKKKKQPSKTNFDQSVVPAAETVVQAPESTKKSKKKLRSESQQHEDTTETSLIITGSGKKKKNKLHIEQSDLNEAETSIGIPGSDKKKKQPSETNFDQSVIPAAETVVQAPESTKKSKKKLRSESQQHEDTAETSLIIPGSGKKKKNKSHIEQSDLNEAETSIGIPGSGKKKKQPSETNFDQSDIPAEVLSKKRKRKSSGNTGEHDLGTEGEDIVPQTLDTSLSAGRQNKKRKVSQNETNANSDGTQKKNLNKKRKRDSDDQIQDAKKLKESSFDKVHVPRLPASILNLLDDKPKTEILDMKKSTVISTTPFVVEEAKKRKKKPSAYLEESVYLNEQEHRENKQKGHVKAPKVLPFIPTATTSNSGFTTNFKIKIIPQQVKFVAQTKDVANFKTDYLYGNKIKRLGTYEMYKKHRTHKISKF